VKATSKRSPYARSRRTGRTVAFLGLDVTVAAMRVPQGCIVWRPRPGAGWRIWRPLEQQRLAMEDVYEAPFGYVTGTAVARFSRHAGMRSILRGVTGF